MKLLQRQIFKSAFFSSATAVALFVFLLVVGNTVNDLLDYVLDGRLKPEIFIELVLLLVPFAVSYALPIGVLTGVLLVLGRMSADQEVTAIRAAGLGMTWIARPVLLMAVPGVLACAAINFEFMPWARVRYHRELDNAVRVNPLSFVAPRTFVRDFPGKVLYVGASTSAGMKDFWLWELDEKGRVKNFLRAESGSLAFDEEKGDLIVNLRHIQLEIRDRKDPENFTALPPYLNSDQTSVRLPLASMFGRRPVRHKLAWDTFSELMAEWRRLSRPATDAAERRQLAIDRMKVQMVVQEKLATSFAVFSFAFIGVALGITTSRRESYANLSLAVILSMGYQFLATMVGWLDRLPEVRPDLLLWAPNLLILGLGIRLFRRLDWC